MRFTIVILGILFAYKAIAAESTSDEALILAAEKLIQEGGVITRAENATSATPEVASELKEIKEADIPVNLTTAAKEKTADSMFWRLIASFGFISIIAGALFYAAKRWRRPLDKNGKGARIEMMHQFHFGPRKSMALMRVAGETMLIGITDHNISMIKSVSLIDDELEGLVKKPDFNNFLEDEFSIEDVRSVLRA